MMLGCIEVRQEVRIESSLKGELIYTRIYDINDNFIALARKIEKQEKLDPESKKVGIQVKSDFKTDDDLRRYICSCIREENDRDIQKISFEDVPGVKMKHYEFNDEDVSHPYIKMTIAFDNILRLEKLEKQLENQLQGFSVKKKGTHIILEQKLDAEKLIESKTKGIPMDMNKNTPHNKHMKNNKTIDKQNLMMMQGLAKNMQVKFRVRIPYQKYEAIKHNAHREDKKNHTLYWEFNRKTPKNAFKNIFVELAPITANKHIEKHNKKQPKGSMQSPKH